MFTLFYRLIALISLFFITACSQSLHDVQPAQLGRIIDLRSGQILTPAAFSEMIASTQRLLIGEQHDNHRHHQAQLWLLNQLHRQRPQAALLMEMLSVEQQPLIANLSPNAAACLACLPDKLRWKASWNWAFYGELVQTALQQRIALTATNLTAAEVQTLMNGAEPLNGYRSTEPSVQTRLAELITAQHGMTSGENPELIRKMVQVQQFRDRRMAEKVAQSPTPSLLIAGNHHVNRRFGVPLHLTDLAPDIDVISVLLGEEPSGYSAIDADYFWILP